MKEKFVELIDYNLSDLLFDDCLNIHFYSYRVILLGPSCSFDNYYGLSRMLNGGMFNAIRSIYLLIYYGKYLRKFIKEVNNDAQQTNC